MQCPQCNYERQANDLGDTNSCPSCGIVYKKALIAKLSQADPLIKEEISDKNEKTGWLSNVLFEIQDACIGKFWVLRVPVIFLFFWVLFRKLQDYQNFAIFDGINLSLHEMGHPLFHFFGKFMLAAGGTILQCFAPIAAGIVLLKQRDYFGICFCGVWLATNLISVGVYMADATDLKLNYVTIGGTSEPTPIEDMHDWYIMFDKLGLFMYDKPIGNFTAGLGVLLLLFSIVTSIVIVYWMWKYRNQKALN